MISEKNPHVIVIAEPNGAGKSTTAPVLLKGTLGVTEFVNAVARVAERVRMGGHDVPEETIRRRYNKGIENFFRLYRPLSDTWRMYNNSVRSGPRIVADGGTGRREAIYDPATWSMIRGEHNERS